MTRLLLVRHAATVLNADDRFAGSTDVLLGPEGRDQAERLGQRLATEPIETVYCSPLRRTVETATILARPHALTPQTVDGLREIDHGRWEGLRRSEVESLYPEEYAAWVRDPLAVGPTEGESGQRVMARALAAVAEIVHRHADQQVLVVSHKGTIRLVVANLLGLDGRGYRDRLDQAPACLNVLDVDDTLHARLILFNDVSHYAGSLQSPRM